MNFYKRYPGDYMRDTAHLSLMEHGAYCLLLDHLYGTEKPIKNPAGFYRVCRSVSDEEKNAVDAVRDEFFTETDEGWVNNRVMEEIGKANDKRKVSKTNGKLGGRPKSENPEKTQKKPNKNPEQNPEETQSKPTEKPIPDTRRQTPDARRQTPESETPDAKTSASVDSDSTVQDLDSEGTGDISISGFSEKNPAQEQLKTHKGHTLTGDMLKTFNTFWDTFAYKDGKREAAESWYQMWKTEKPDEWMLDQIMRGAEREARNRPKLRSEGRTPKMAQGWITARRWEDEHTHAGKQESIGQANDELARRRAEQRKQNGGAL